MVAKQKDKTCSMAEKHGRAVFTVHYSAACGHGYDRQWNSWFDAMLYNRMKTEYTTLQYELMKLLSSVMQQSGSAENAKNGAATITPITIRAATTVVTMLPIVCLYPFLQRYFVTGLTIGGVKE